MVFCLSRSLLKRSARWRQVSVERCGRRGADAVAGAGADSATGEGDLAVLGEREGVTVESGTVRAISDSILDDSRCDPECW